MKVNKQITLDLEIYQTLNKEPNASGLINELLTKHFKTNSRVQELAKLPKEELQALKEKTLKKIKLRKQLEAMDNE